MIYTEIKEYNEELKYLAYPLEYSEYVEKYAEEFGIDKYLLYAYIKTESGFDNEAVSSANAIGLTQITNETFAWIKLKHAPYEELVFEDLFNPELSIRFGAYFISRNMERYNNDIATAAAAYHSGWGTVDALLEEQESDILLEFPYEQMSNYVYKIDKAYTAYLELYTNQEEI